MKLNILRHVASAAIAWLQASPTATLAATVTAIFDLTSATPTLVAAPGQSATFTANTGIRFSAVGGAIPSRGSGIVDASVESGQGGAGVAGDTFVNGFEFVFFSGPSRPEDTPLPGRWTAFTATGKAATGVESFRTELRDAIDINANRGLFSISCSEYPSPKRLTIDRAGDNDWTLTSTRVSALLTIRSLECTRGSRDIPTDTSPVPLPAAAGLLLGGLDALETSRVAARGRRGCPRCHDAL